MPMGLAETGERGLLHEDPVGDASVCLSHSFMEEVNKLKKKKKKRKEETKYCKHYSNKSDVSMTLLKVSSKD